MKQVVFGTFCFILLTPFLVFGQTYVPTPVSDAEIRDRSSIRMRSIELERVKRDSEKLVLNESDEERTIKFALVKGDYEKIQKLQNSIVKAYTTGKEINFSKITNSAAKIRKRCVRLDENLFAGKSVADEKEINTNNPIRLTLRNAIIDLDNAILRFVSSPMFQNIKLVDTKISETTQLDLAKILILSESISKQAYSLQ